MYSSVQPLSQRQNGQYLPNDTIDFLISFSGREIDPASIRISGELYVTQNGNPVTGAQQVVLDPKVGAHALFQQYITMLPDVGMVVENFQHVPRWVAMTEASSHSKIQTGSGIDTVCELKTATTQQSRAILAQDGDKQFASFSIRPHCALTKASANISWQKTGTIKLTCLMSSVYQVLSGADVNVNTSYYIKNLQLDYMTDIDTNQPLQMAKVSSLKQTLSSSNQQLALTLPQSSTSLTMSFVPIVSENTATYNYTSLETVPDVSRVEFSFNDIVSGSLITYALENKEEILYNALLSMAQSDKFDLTQTLVDLSKGFTDNYLIGTGFGNIAVSQSTRVGVNIQSAIQANNTMACYLYFKGGMTL